MSVIRRFLLLVTLLGTLLAVPALTASASPASAPARATLTAVVQPAVSAQAAHFAHLAHLAHLARIGTAPVRATLTASYSTTGDRLLNAAETRAGDWYVYGAAGPSTFDCSGLVYWSAHQIGISLPRTTYSIPSSGWLYRVYTPRRGDLAFFGAGHVEIVTAWYHTTFGAAHSGTRVSWHTWGNYWAPTAYYRVR